MARPIVVPLLDSVFSPRATPALTELARCCGAELHLLDLRPVSPGEESSGPRLLQQARVRSIREAYCAHIAAQVAEQTGPGGVRVTSREGDPARELARYTVEQGALLIALVLENREMAGEAESRLLARELHFRTGSPVLLLISRADGSREVSLEGPTPEGVSRADLMAIVEAADDPWAGPPLIGA